MMFQKKKPRCPSLMISYYLHHKSTSDLSKIKESTIDISLRTPLLTFMRLVSMTIKFPFN